MKTFSCTHCGQTVFFENTACVNCGSALGFVPELLRIVAFDVSADGAWTAHGMNTPAAWRPCHNYATEQVCNWMVEAADPQVLCRCCRYTSIIPALNKPENKAYWLNLEAAKRRLFYSLIDLQLPIPDRIADPSNGLVFHFLEDADPKQRVLTGHASGLITMNIEEADDAKREARRSALHEPYRTILGHFRHEIGHFYWDHLIARSNYLDAFRERFGDERADYSAALQRHYAEGPLADWQANYISAYATMHPWEDWAECWAHYMHVVDALNTAGHWGLSLGAQAVGRTRAGRGGKAAPAAPAQLKGVDADGQPFDQVLVNQWLPLARFLNSMGRSLGRGDFYPFVLPPPVLDKLGFIHEVVAAAREGRIVREPVEAVEALQEAPAAAAPDAAPAPLPAAPAIAS
ncbi:MAG: hypothetical protein EPO01_16890 [Aquabacterium sp.]|nr:MAG: hypothetical protein EPO01_16890 [Aquabacterium sp.]